MPPALPPWQVSGIRDAERLAFSAINLTTEAVLEEEEAERLVNSASNESEDWTSARNTVDTDKVELAYDMCEEVINQAYDHYVERIVRENQDRADVLLKTATDHFQGQIKKLEERIKELREDNKLKTIPMNQGKINKHKQRLELRLDQIEKSREISHSYGDVALGIIDVR